MRGGIRICNFSIPWRKLAPMKKAEKIEKMLGDLAADREPGAGLDPCYEGYFTCFNSQRYYEAHDVLEHLWLKNRDADYAFYKGLIQLAGAYVHLQKQFERPHHPKDRNRTHPAVRLFHLAARNLAPYRPRHLRLDVERVWGLSTNMAEQIIAAEYANPWSPGAAPVLTLEGTE
jgi:predicted metal-dependent hydrolase